MKLKVMCEKCKYAWMCRSEKQYVSCPNCLQKTKNAEVQEQ